MKLTTITEISDEQEFYAGVEFRIYNVGMNVSEDEDFYDYMLINLNWEPDYLLLVNVTRDNYRAGSVMCMIGIDSKIGNKTVSCKAVKESIGTKDTYLIVY